MRIVLATLGSLGDLHPCLALGLELARRGHRVTIVSTALYRARVEALGLRFKTMRPDWDPKDREMIRQCEDLRTGPEILFCRLILPHLRDSYADLLAACMDADVLISGEMVFAAPLAAEKLRLPWVSLTLSPCSFLSAQDPSVLPGLNPPRWAGSGLNRVALQFVRLAMRSWWEPVRQLRREQGLRPDCEPFFRDKFSPYLGLALFSSQLAAPQPDWPKRTVQPGFVFYDQPKREDNIPLIEFLDAGTPAIVFTLGSTAVANPGNFYEEGIEAALRLGRRALLLGAPDSLSIHSADVLSLAYAPYSQVFPHAAVIVHQGGSGTTAQALRAARPMLIVPYGWDQPDNAARVARLGAGLTASRRGFTSKVAEPLLKRLLYEPQFQSRAEQIASAIRKEDALTAACNAVEQILDENAPVPPLRVEQLR